jgi:DNA excision repair protein ERCC-4
MESKLKTYLFWKGKLGNKDTKPASNENNADSGGTSNPNAKDTNVSEALRRKDARTQQRQGSRRRLRGAPPGSNIPGASGVERSKDAIKSGPMGGEGVVKEEAEELALL